MNVKPWLPFSAFDLSYFRRIYVLGLLGMMALTGALTYSDVSLPIKLLFGIFLVMSFLGIFTRVAMLALVIVSIKLLRLEPFANVPADYYLDLGLILLATRCSDVLSVDGMFQSWARADRGEIAAPRPSVVYFWPLCVIWIYGLAALVVSSLGHPGILTIFVFIYLTSFFSWSWMTREAGRKIHPKPMFVVYDGNCKLCRRTAAFFNSVDEFECLTYVNGMSEEDLKRHGLTHLDRANLAKDMHVIYEGKTYLGFLGYREMVKRIPILWFTVPLAKLKVVADQAQKIYRKVADSRACSIPSASAPKLVWTDPPVRSFDIIAPTVIAMLLLVGHFLNLK